MNLLARASKPLACLFHHVRIIEEQWLVAKVIPIHKKDDKTDTSNYRPIANLCSTSKIFERLILQRIGKLEVKNDIDITNKGQHGYKKGKSTNTVGLLIRSLITAALDD